MAGIWTEELVTKLRQLFDQNLSGRLIAKHLGLTRNQVIGKLDRLGLERTGPSIGMNRPARTSVAEKKVQIRRFASNPYANLADADVVPLHVNMIDLQPDQCRYPYGDGPFTFCGCSKIADSSYCGPHHALTHGDQRQTAEQVAINKRAYRSRMIAEAA